MIKAFVRATFAALLISAFIGVVPLPAPSAALPSTPPAAADVTEVDPLPEAPPEFVRHWNGAPSTFSYPRGVAVNPTDASVFVADDGNHQIQRFEADGTFIARWLMPGYGNPQGVAVAPDGTVYATSSNTSRVERFTTSGDPTGGWGGLTDPRGIAVDGDGFVYVAETGANRVSKFGPTGTPVRSWGVGGSGDGEFNQPIGVAVAPDGTVYVADYANSRIQHFTADGGFLGKWGEWGSANSQFRSPTGVAVDASSRVYVADYLNDRIQKFTATGGFLSTWGTSGSGDNQFNLPHGLAVADPYVYVAEYSNGRVQQFWYPASIDVTLSADETAVTAGDPIHFHVAVTNTGGAPLTNVSVHDEKVPACDGDIGTLLAGDDETYDCTFTATLTTIGTFTNRATVESTETAPTESNSVDVEVSAATPTLPAPQYLRSLQFDSMSDPKGVAVHQGSGDVYVADLFGSFTRWGADGQYFGTFGEEQLESAAGIAVDQASGDVFVVDRDSGTVNRFSRTGTFEHQWGGFTDPVSITVGSCPGLGDLVYVGDAGTDHVSAYDTEGGGLGGAPTDADPLGLAMSGSDLYTTLGPPLDRVVRTSCTGSPITEWGNFGTVPGAFQTPVGVTVDASGRVFVADAGNNRVQAFQPDGRLLGLWGEQGSGPGEFQHPLGVAAGPGDRVYVSDEYQDPEGFGRVQVFDYTVPGVSIDKTVLEDTVVVGDTIHYEVTVTNTGTAPLTGVSITDPHASSCEQAPEEGYLAVGETHTVQCSHTTTGDDHGTYTNTATVNTDVTEPLDSNSVSTEVTGTGVSGTLTDASTGDPVAGGWVAVLRTSDFSIVGSGVADGYGGYSALVGPGSYFLYLIDPTGDHVAGFHGPPTTVVVSAGTMVDVDPAMTPTRGSIAGTITADDTGDPVAGAWAITLSGTTIAPETGVTAGPDGSFSVGRLRPGNHYLVAIDPTGEYRPEFYPNSPNALGASPLAVTVGHATPVDLALPAQTPIAGGSTLTGTVTESGTGTPLAGVYAIALRAADYRFARGAVTDADGYYSLDLVAGDYKVEFVDSSGLHDMEWHDNHPYYDIALADSAAAPGTANAALAPRTGTMAGTVTVDMPDEPDRPLGDAWVIAIAPNGIAGGAVTDLNGTYTIAGLPPGTYRATFADPVGGLPQEYWDDSPGFEGATPIPITAGATVTIDAGLLYW